MAKHMQDQRFKEAIDRIDAANRDDLRTELVDGKPQPRELLFAQRVYAWVCKLVDDPSEELLLAARAHTLRRWLIPRERYPRTSVGYHQSRDALAQFHAKEAEEILCEVGYRADAIRRVEAFITRANWPAEPEACALEDAGCLVFLETKLQNYVGEWEEEKTLRVLQRTLRKMTPNAREHALRLKLGEREGGPVRRTVT